MTPLGLISLFVFLILYAWTLYTTPILAVGLKHLLKRLRRGSSQIRKDGFLSKSNLPFVSIIVPVKDEEKVIARELEALMDLEYPKESSEIIIIEDGSKDKTFDICRKYADEHAGYVKLFHRKKSNGKPSALNYALGKARGEILAIFDADCVPESDALLRAVECFKDSSVAAVQGSSSSINANENMLTRLISYEEAVGVRMFALGRDALNLFVYLTGSCCFLRKRLLRS